MTYRTLACLSLTTAALVASTRPAAAEELRDYVVRPGDTCISIARRELSDRRAYAVIHRHNPQLGKQPHTLVPGSVLKLPSTTSAADARLTSARGRVEVRPPAASLWDKAQVGMALFSTWRVGSRAQSSAEVTFQDASRLYLRDDTVVVIFGASAKASRAKEAPREAVLERGTLEHRLAQAGAPVRVYSGGAASELGRSEAVISVDEGGTSVIANRGGAAVAVRSVDARRRPTSKPVAVNAGMGSRVKRGKPPEPPRPLPPAPAWQGAPPSLVVLGEGAKVTLRGQWASVVGAAGYRVMISRQGAGEVESVAVPAQTTRFELADATPGIYSVKVAAFDAQRFESPWSVEQTLLVSVVTLAPPAGAAPGAAGAPAASSAAGAAGAPSAAGAPGRAVLAVGTVLRGPQLRCGFDGGPKVAELVATLPGPARLECEDQGRALEPVMLEVLAPPAPPAPPAAPLSPAPAPAPAPAPVAAPAPQPPRWRVGPFLGALQFPRAHAPGFGHGALPGAATASEDATYQLGGGLLFGLRAGYLLSPSVELAGEVATLRNTVRDRPDYASLLAARATVSVRMNQEGAVSSHGVLGLGALALTARDGATGPETALLGLAGMSLRYQHSPGIELRLDGRVHLGAGWGERTAVGLEGLLGLAISR